MPIKLLVRYSLLPLTVAAFGPHRLLAWPIYCTSSTALFQNIITIHHFKLYLLIHRFIYIICLDLCCFECLQVLLKLHFFYGNVIKAFQENMKIFSRPSKKLIKYFLHAYKYCILCILLQWRL